jgi:hypothetical protein
MARRTRNIGMWFALGVGAFYLWKQYKAKQVAALPAPASSVSQAVVQSTAAGS